MDAEEEAVLPQESQLSKQVAEKKEEGPRPATGKTAASRPKTPFLAEPKFRRTSVNDANEVSPGAVLITQDPESDECDVQQTEIQTSDWLANFDPDNARGDPDDESDLDSDDSSRGYYNVDITLDNGYDTDLEVNDEEFINGPEVFDPSGIHDYIEECNKLGVLPCSYFERHVHAKEFTMKNHGLGPLGAKAIAKGLEMNRNLEKIDLEGNWLEAEGAKYISRVMKDNIYVTDLVLSENKLGSLGAYHVCQMLTENNFIRTIDLSGNDFHDSDGVWFQKMLESNSTVRRLYLSHNNFGTEAAKAFRDALSINESLRLLDLSWNNFRLKGAGYIADGVKENYGLKELCLSMNGFAKEGSKALGVALKVNQCLEELDISQNRISPDGALEIARALQTNSDLKIVKIGGNPIGLTGALTLLTAIKKNENTEMNILHMAGVFVDDDFETLHTKMLKTRELRVIHSGVISKSRKLKVKYISYNAAEAFENDPMTKLRKYADAAGLRLVDLFKEFDKDKSWTVDYEEFRMGVQASGIKMSEDDINKLIKKLDKDGDGEIDYREFTIGDNEHREDKRKLDKMIADKKIKLPTEVDRQSISSNEAMLNMLDVEDPPLQSS